MKVVEKERAELDVISREMEKENNTLKRTLEEIRRLTLTLSKRLNEEKDRLRIEQERSIQQIDMLGNDTLKFTSECESLRQRIAELHQALEETSKDQDKESQTLAATEEDKANTEKQMGHRVRSGIYDLTVGR